MPRIKFFQIFIALLLMVSVSACAVPEDGSTGNNTEQAVTEQPSVVPSPQPSPTPNLPRVLTVCMGQEPNSLYPLSALNSSARSVLGAIYDGPVDIFTNGLQPVILKNLPSIENGQAQVASVPVKRGDSVVGADGNLAVLDYGVKVLPSGCKEDTCAIVYDGRSDLKMDQMVVTFQILPGILWSDGQPLTAEDSVFAFGLASDKASTGSKFLIDRTSAYEAVDLDTVQWWGLPGYVDSSYASNFWSPLPKHLWGNVPASELAKGDITKYPPVGWGAYVFKEWSAGTYIALEKNPNYFRAGEGLPKFDSLTFLFVKDAAAGISSLVSGQCDVLDTSLRLESEIDLLTELQRNEQVKLSTATTPLIERLDIGIVPSSYDDGYAPGYGDRQDIFGDVRTRQGIAYCLDRQKIITSVLDGISKVPDTFISPEHPLFNNETAKYEFDLKKGSDLLALAGWIDADGNPTTPRVASGVKNVVNGTPLILTYQTTTALQRRLVSEILSQSLSECGVGLDIKYTNQDEFYAPGPDGALFGRQFDLAEYALGVVGTEPPCAWFMTEQIPTKKNKWLGVNISGYSNSDYDLQCHKAMNSLPGTQEYTDAYAQVQSIFANDLPSIPLYMRIKAAASRSDMCNFTLDAFAVNDLWNIEELDYGQDCGN